MHESLFDQNESLLGILLDLFFGMCDALDTTLEKLEELSLDPVGFVMEEFFYDVHIDKWRRSHHHFAVLVYRKADVFCFRIFL